VTSVQPLTGQRGTLVAIQGTDLLAGDLALRQVQLAGATVVSANNSAIVVSAGASPSVVSGNASVLPASGSFFSSSIVWAYLQGAIATVSPNFGQAGTYVQILGARLLGGGSRVVPVTLAGVAATLVSDNDTVVSVRALAGVNGTGHVVLTSDSGALVTLENVNGWTLSLYCVVLRASKSVFCTLV
jgi:mucin-19